MRGDNAGGQREGAYAKNGDDRAKEAANSGHRIDVAESDRGQGADRPPEGSEKTAEGVGLRLAFDDVQRARRNEKNRDQTGKRRPQLLTTRTDSLNDEKHPSIIPDES